MHLRITLAAAIALLLPLASHAQETFTIKFKKGSAAVVTHQERSSTTVENIKVSDTNGKELQNVVTTTVLAEAYDETILEKPDPKKKATA